MGSPHPGTRRHTFRRWHLPCGTQVSQGLSSEPTEDEIRRRNMASKWYCSCNYKSIGTNRVIVYTNGEVCISILHPPGDDPNHYESASERWSPIQSVEKILISVMSMLAEPNDESPANVEAAKMWRERRVEFEKKVREGVRRSLGL